jgi:hypothetical protein
MSKLKDSVAEFSEVTPSAPLVSIRTSKGIKVRLKRLRAVWAKHPEMKLGQLLTAPFSDGYLHNLRNLGDDKLLEILEKWHDGE